VRTSYKYRLYPNKKQTAALENHLDLLRELYNAAIQERRDAWKMNRVRVTGFDQINQIPAIRASRPDMMLIRSRVLAQTLRQADKAFSAFFRRVKAGEYPGYPRFKGKAFFNTFHYNASGFRLINDNRLQLSSVGQVKIKLSRAVEGTIKEVCVKREGSKWYAILSCDGIPECPLPLTSASVGIDVGIESFATLSDGEQIANPRCYESSQRKLRIAQRRVSRRKKGSNGRRKAVAVLRNVHQKIVNQRVDFQHKVSTDLISRYDLIAVEGLNVKGLARMRLAKQVLDASWSSFIDKLSYKAECAGRTFVKVNPNGTSQICSSCGERCEKALSVRMHHCSHCGLSLHRDHNAALNILRLGQSLVDLTCRNTESVSAVAV
jgi:putative transposase